MKWVAAVIISVFAAMLAAQVIRAEEKFRWKDTYERPYGGTMGEALKALVQCGLPSEAITPLLKAGAAYGKLAKGEECACMVWGDGRIAKNVVVEWKDRTELNTEDYPIGGFVVRKVLEGNNWLFCRKKTSVRAVASAKTITVQPTPAPREPTAGAERAAESERKHFLRIHFWDYAQSPPEGKELLARLVSGVRGGQSADLGDRILDLAADGKVAKVADCHDFSVRLYDADRDKMPDTEIIVNGTRKVFGRDLEAGSPITVRVCNDESQSGGYVATRVKPPWATERMSATISSPFNSLRYPARGVLRSCGPATAGRCGSPYDFSKPTRLFLRLQEEGETNYHFVR